MLKKIHKSIIATLLIIVLPIAVNYGIDCMKQFQQNYQDGLGNHLESAASCSGNVICETIEMYRWAMEVEGYILEFDDCCDELGNEGCP